MDEELLQDIKFNCDVSDAQYWGYFSVCGLLMRYRDLFRSERGLKPWASLDRAEIGAWIEAKEGKWPDLERRDLRDLRIGGRTFAPFAVEEINNALADRGLVYGAGYGMYLKPTFFLAELHSVREVDGLRVFLSGRELVRDLFSAPALQQQKSIFLRLEPLVMLLLYKHGELNVRRVSALEDAFLHYGFPQRQIVDITFEQKLEQAALRFAEVLLAHERAEAAEEVPEWKDLLARATGDRQAEHYLRAVKDLLADTAPNGPYRMIIETRDRGALGLVVALMEGYRRTLFPEMREAYGLFLQHGDWGVIEQARGGGYGRFRTMRDEIVACFRSAEGRDDFLGDVKKRIRSAPGKGA